MKNPANHNSAFIKRLHEISAITPTLVTVAFSWIFWCLSKTFRLFIPLKGWTLKSANEYSQKHRSAILTTLILALLLIPGMASATIYYVRTDGNDSNPGDKA